MLEKDARNELMDRGYSRRQLGRIAAALVGGGAALGPFARTAFAQSQAARGVKGAVQIGANKCWTGPFPAALAAGAAILAQGT